jgi:hypothetical protein
VTLDRTRRRLPLAATASRFGAGGGGEGCQNYVHSGRGSVVLVHEPAEAVASLDIAAGRWFELWHVADGDPAVAFGPKPGPNGFHWSNGWRLYYANLASNFSSERAEFTIKGFEAIAVSRLDDVNLPAAMAGSNTAWKAPVIASKQNAALFSDHEQIAVDDAEASPFFGNAYVCNAAFRSQEISPNSLPRADHAQRLEGRRRYLDDQAADRGRQQHRRRRPPRLPGRHR